MKRRSLLITLLSLILTFSVSIGLTTSIAYADETPLEYSMGDANLDGNVNTRDVVLIKQSIVGLTELNDKQKVFADVYADGQINTRDVVLIQQSIVGMDVDLGTHEHSFENGVCICGYVEPHTHNYSELKFDVDSHWHECSCGAYEIKENHIPGAEATETTDQKCTECNYVITPALGHVHTLHLTKVDAKPQSCTQEGNVEYYTCSCGKWFTDNTATTEITDKSSVVIEKDDHKYETLKKTATEHWWECSCGDKDGLEEHHGGEATCTQKAVCTDCGLEYGSLEKHNYTELKQSATQHWYECTCGDYETKENHKGGTATCQVKATCSVCDTIYGDFAEHEPKTAWVITDTHHYHECAYNCGEKLSYKEHSFTNYVSNKDATYESDGTKTAQCDGGCGKTHTVTDAGSMLIKDEIRFTTLTVDGKNVYGTVSNSVEKFYFDNEIIISGKANFIVSLDEDGIQSSITKSMPLSEGDNTFYVLETINGVYNQTYIITIHRNYMFTVNFMVDDEAIKTEQIEENQQVTAPIVQEKYGYTFDGWQANSSFVSFPYTVTKNTTFKAIYTPIPYTVTYYIDTYDSEGVITSKTETIIYTIEDMVNGKYSLKNTVKDDYVFYGWTTEKQFEPTNTILSVNELKDYVFYGYYEYGTKGVVYEKTGETYAVAGYEGVDSDFVIAVLHNGIPVTTINPSALKDNLTVESITISKYISSIGLFAFNGCKNVTQVYYAADNCQNLAEDTRAFYYLGQNKTGVTVTITDNVQRIPEHLFFAWILDTTKTYHPKLKTVQFEDNSVCQEIGKRAFGWCFEISSIEIPESIKTIGKEAFSKLYYVENIYFNAIECDNVAVTDKVFEDLSKHNNGTIITVGKNVTTIPAGMFNGTGGTTTNIKEISFATNGALTSIGRVAFAGAKKLTKVEIPETIQNVELNAFMYCSSLTEFTVPKSVKILDLTGCTSLIDITFNNVIEELNVNGCSSLKDVTLPNTLKKVDFSYCTSIKAVELPDSVISAMFTGCSKLETMTLPAGFTEVADGMFKDCTFLQGVEFEGVITRVGDYAFSNCTTLGGSRPYTIKHIGAHAYEYTEITMFSASYNLESIGEYAFRGCSKLWDVSFINGNVKTISKYAFYNCTALENLDIDFGVENIEEYAFYNTALTSVELPISVTKLGSNAFNYENFDLILENKVKPSEFLYSTYYSSDTTYGNNNVTSNNYSYVVHDGKAYLTKYHGSEKSITIPTEIDGHPVVALVGTYCGNSYINEVYIPESITWIDYDAFYNCNNITAFYLYLDSKPDNWHDSWNHDKTTYWDYQGVVSENGFDFVVVGEEAYITEYNGRSSDLVIPDTVNDKPIKGFIGDVFNGNTSIKSISLSNNINAIPDRLFYNCTSLTTIKLGDVKKIGAEAFYGCYSLIYNEKDGLKYLGNDSTQYFYLVDVVSSNISTATIDNNCRFIASSAFLDCSSLTSITIPDSVMSIGGEAFTGCTNLSKVNYLGTIDQWVQIQFEYTEYIFPYGNGKPNYSNPLYYAKKLYINNQLITSVNISNAHKINDGAFYYCESLINATIGNSVTSIGYGAFIGCNSLTSIEIPDSVTSIGKYAFSGCSSLTKITLPFIGASLSGTEGTHFGYIFGAYEYEVNNSYVPNSLKTVIITGGEILDDGAFWNCQSLTNIILPNSLTKVGVNVFYNCKNLQYNVDGNFKYLGNLENEYLYLAENVSRNITSVTINENCKIIGAYVFYDCDLLTSVKIPNSIISIGTRAFDMCSLLEVIYCETLYQPNNWDIDWNCSGKLDANLNYIYYPVVWGYKG